MSQNFLEFTEIAGDMVSQEQVDRIARRYYWAAEYCQDKDVLEVACGSGQGVGYLASAATSLVAGDFSGPTIDIARKHYGQRFHFEVFDAQSMPFNAASFDVVLIFEALYYLPDPESFFVECKRVLRPGGVLLISNANKDLYDFNPSPHSHIYHGLIELERVARQHGFTSIKCFGDTPLGALSLKQRILRPAKALASRLHLIPESKAAKNILKRFVFGNLVPMPAEISAQTSPYFPPTLLPSGVVDRLHKVIFAALFV